MKLEGSKIKQSLKCEQKQNFSKSIIHKASKQGRAVKTGLLPSLLLAAVESPVGVFQSRNKRGWDGMRLKCAPSSLLRDKKCLDVAQMYVSFPYS